MKCPICKTSEASANFHSLFVCEDCKKSEEEAIEKDKESIKNSGL